MSLERTHLASTTSTTDSVLPDVVFSAMAEAIEEAKAAAYPFGAILLDHSGQITARAGNSCDSGDPTAHAEVNVLRKTAGKALDLTRCALVTTAEPCCMCMAGALLGRIPRVYYGSSITTLLSQGWHQPAIPAREVAARAHSTSQSTIIVGGVRESECDLLYATSSQMRATTHEHVAGVFDGSNANRQDEPALARSLTKLPEWSYRDNTLCRTYLCADFQQSVRLLDQVAALAQEMNHHPDFSVTEKRFVHVETHTRRAGAVTTADLALAAACEKEYHRLTGTPA